MNAIQTHETNADTLNSQRLSRAESARINGSKSRGPKTPEGKARSSRNALRHGLLSKRLSPLSSSSGERADYEHHLRGLTREFRPQTQTEVNLVETIARDWVRHGRIGQVSDNLIQPFSKKGFKKASQTLSELLFEHDTLESALESLEKDDHFGLNREQQVVVRNAILALANPPAPAGGADADPNNLTPHELLANHEIDDLVLRIDDASHVIGVLADKADLTDEELMQWLAFLRFLDRRAVSQMHNTTIDDHEHERACRSTVVEEVHEIPVLDRLVDIEAKNRRAIRENIEMLMRLRNARQAGSGAT